MKSWNIPGFDVYDPSLIVYAPLWRPDMVARGGSIKNGTGTMDVNPQALAIGANTITVTAAGTLIVAMPEGGTVASGTMTVTGSPVTVSAGISTTITTTGATGNITVTPSNIIRSKDRGNNHALTVTGATHGIQGRTFDGTDDRIVIPNSSSLQFGTGDFSYTIWATKGTQLTDFPCLIGRHDNISEVIQIYENGDSGAVSAYMNIGGVIKEAGLGTISKNIFYHFAVVKTNDTLFAYRGATLINQTAHTYGNTDKAVDWLIGAMAPVAPARFWLGTIGEVSIYNRALSAVELQQNYQATKWRYQ